jgi:hypothetical protein
MAKVRFVFQSIAIIFIILAAIGSHSQLNASTVTATNTTLTEERYVGQKTEMSNPASPTVTPHGKLPHQVVFALPLRNDSQIWTGTVTFTASKPIELKYCISINLNLP